MDKTAKPTAVKTSKRYSKNRKVLQKKRKEKGKGDPPQLGSDRSSLYAYLSLVAAELPAQTNLDTTASDCFVGVLLPDTIQSIPLPKGVPQENFSSIISQLNSTYINDFSSATPSKADCSDHQLPDQQPQQRLQQQRKQSPQQKLQQQAIKEHLNVVPLIHQQSQNEIMKSVQHSVRQHQPSPQPYPDRSSHTSHASLAKSGTRSKGQMSDNMPQGYTCASVNDGGIIGAMGVPYETDVIPFSPQFNSYWNCMAATSNATRTEDASLNITVTSYNHPPVATVVSHAFGVAGGGLRLSHNSSWPCVTASSDTVRLPNNSWPQPVGSHNPSCLPWSSMPSNAITANGSLMSRNSITNHGMMLTQSIPNGCFNNIASPMNMQHNNAGSKFDALSNNSVYAQQITGQSTTPGSSPMGISKLVVPSENTIQSWQQNTAQPWQHNIKQPWQQKTAQPWQQGTAQPWHQNTAQPWQQSIAQPWQQGNDQPWQQNNSQPWQQNIVQPWQQMPTRSLSNATPWSPQPNGFTGQLCQPMRQNCPLPYPQGVSYYQGSDLMSHNELQPHAFWQ